MLREFVPSNGTISQATIEINVVRVTDVLQRDLLSFGSSIDELTRVFQANMPVLCWSVPNERGCAGSF